VDWRELLNDNALDRFRPMWLGIESALLLVGLLFWISTGFGVDSFSPETWGEWACQWPAVWWAAVQSVSAAMIITGLLRPVTARRVALGAAIQAVQFAALAYSATFTGGQFVIGVYPSVLFVPFHIVLMVEALRYEPR
jgi:hypothetical protein